MRPVVSRQHLMTELLVLTVDGSDVTTTSDNAGLDYGEHVANVLKGSGADSNLVTITLRNQFGLPPNVFFSPRTLDCTVRLEEPPTRTTIKYRTFTQAGTAKADDADLDVLIVGTRELRQGNYG